MTCLPCSSMIQNGQMAHSKGLSLPSRQPVRRSSRGQMKLPFFVEIPDTEKVGAVPFGDELCFRQDRKDPLPVLRIQNGCIPYVTAVKMTAFSA